MFRRESSTLLMQRPPTEVTHTSASTFSTPRKDVIAVGTLSAGVVALIAWGDSFASRDALITAMAFLIAVGVSRTVRSRQALAASAPQREVRARRDAAPSSSPRIAASHAKTAG